MTTFGDNDRLAAMVTNLIRAPLLVLLSDVDGLFDGDPRDQSKLPTVTGWQVDFDLVRDSHGPEQGGMARKLDAARIATTAGENVIIANGRTPGNLARIVAGETVGTLFLAQGQTIPSFKRWIGFTAQPRGTLVVDTGAREAVERKGKSLLAIGVVEARGNFRKGDIVSLQDAAGSEFARGLTNYAIDDLQKIKGLKPSK
jgi:glutamate 5-kinase